MKNHIKEAAQAHSNLSTFHTIVQILEGGTIYGGNNKAAERIIAICQQEMQCQLKKYDAAVAASTQEPKA